MAHESLPYDSIRRSSPAELVSLFRTASSSSSSLSPDDITHHLIAGVARGSLPPSPLTIWLQLAKSPSATRLALAQDASAAVRLAGIKQLGKSLASPRWRETWDGGLGGAGGVARLLGGALSVREVAAFARLVGRSVGGVERAEKRDAVLQLARALQPELFPPASASASSSRDGDDGGGDGAPPPRSSDGPHDSDAVDDDDRRPLSRPLAPLAQACPPAAVEDLLSRSLASAGGGGLPAHEVLAQKGVLQRHPAAVQTVVFRAIFDSDSDVVDDRKRRAARVEAVRPALEAFLRGAPSGRAAAHGGEPGLSVSMRFSLELLRRLAAAAAGAEPHAFPPELLVDGLVEPLLRRCRRRQAEPGRVREIVSLAAAVLERWPAAAKGLAFPPDGRWGNSDRGERRLLLHWTARLWSRFPEDGGGGFEEPLRALVRATPWGGVWGRPVVRFALDGVSGPRRYEFLRLCCREAGWGDLDDDGQLKRMGDSLAWDEDVFRWMEAGSAWALFERLRGCCGNFDPNVDNDRLERDLLERKGEVERVVSLATKRMDEQKEEAASSKDQLDRAAHAREALRWASLSGSLKVFKDAILWSRRFVRDTLTVRELYEGISGAKSILVGNPGDLQNDATTREVLRERVVEANDALWTLLETIAMAMREPSADETTPNFTRSLCHDIVKLRWQKFSKALKKTGRFSEEDIYAIMWEDTLTTLARAEKAFLQPGPDRFVSEDREGVLGCSPTVEVENAQPSTYRFFDEFAKARDEVWRDFRSRSLPATALIPEPYPRGLAIQDLTSCFRVRASTPEELTPYITSRTHAVLFMDPAKALAPYPDDEDVQTAIEGFADCYLEALEIFVPKTLSSEERKRRVDKVWAHAVGPLSQPRMSLPEAFRYWRGGTLSERFEFWPKEDAVAPPETELPKHDPRIPRVENPSEVLEWNPLPPAMTAVKERRLDVTYIDIAKSMHIPYIASIRTLSEDEHPTIPGVPADQLYTTLGKDTAVEFESRAMSALLFLDTKNGSSRMLLESPFPSAEEPRYPAMRLDNKFIVKGRKDVHWAFRILKSHSNTVPPLLLSRLAQNSLEEITSAHAGGTIPYDQERTTFGLIALLQESDRPALAADLGIDAIMAFPDASSWHRQLLTPALLRRLPPASARACIARFADALTTRLQAQKDGNASTADDAGASETSPPPPRVKVTTVKHLAQLLHAAAYLPPSSAVAVLARVRRASPHPDVRAAVLAALLGMLDRSASASVRESILTLSEALVVGPPAAAAAASPPPPPPADRDVAGGVPDPLLAVLAYVRDRSGDAGDAGDAAVVAPLVRRVVLPALARLQSLTRAWARDLHPDVVDAEALALAVPPLSPRVWGAVFDAVPPPLVPRGVVEDAAAWARGCAAPSAAAKAVREAARGEADGGSRRWTALFGAGARAVVDGGGGVVGFLRGGVLLRRPRGRRSSGGGGGGVDVAVAQELVMGLFDAVMEADGAEDGGEEGIGPGRLLWPHWKAFVGMFGVPWKEEEEVRGAWVENVRPLVERMVERVEAWRTDEGRQKPPVLPDAFGIGLWLLPWPGVVGEGGEEGCKRFADAVVAVVERLCGEGVGMYHKRFEQVKKEVLARVEDKRDRVWVALRLGSVGEGPFALVERLRIELAEGLLAKFDGEAEKEMAGRVEEMLGVWKRAKDEDVRRTVYELVDRWRANGLTVSWFRT